MNGTISSLMMWYIIATYIPTDLEVSGMKSSYSKYVMEIRHIIMHIEVLLTIAWSESSNIYYRARYCNSTCVHKVQGVI